MTTELKTDVVIIGGGLGGVAAALAAARWGRQVILTEETDWLGGQLTAQGVPPDEHPWLEHYAAPRLYRELRQRIRAYYRRNYPLTPAARDAAYLNPGNGLVSSLCHEPRVALAAIYELLAPYLGSGRITVLLNHRVRAAETDGDRVRVVQVQDLVTGNDLVLRAPYFLDATELGDVLPLAGVEYVTGAEAQAQTGELHAAATAQPQNMQAISWCYALDHLAGEDHTIERPRDYAFWRDYVPALRPAWTGKLLSFDMTHPITLKNRPVKFVPDEGNHTGEPMNLWHYRRIAARRNFVDGAYRSDITLVNWPQMDYWLGNVCDVPEAEAARHRDCARQLSLSLLYWMQTAAPRPDGGTGWPGLRLRGDIMGTTDGLAKYPYIREARRIRAEFTVREQHVGVTQRAPVTLAEQFADTVGVGLYRIDLHPSTGGDNYIDVSCLPFQIPLGALVPVRVENLLPACKNIGTTHITNGCYRLHPVEWNIGEAAGALAAYCIEHQTTPRAVRNTLPQLHDFQSALEHVGVDLSWQRWQAHGV